MRRTKSQSSCVSRTGAFRASLELLKLYQIVADDIAAQFAQICVIDESGEDYLYPREYFVPEQVAQSAEKAVRRVASVRN